MAVEMSKELGKVMEVRKQCPGMLRHVVLTLRWYKTGTVAIYHLEAKKNAVLKIILDKLCYAHWKEAAEWTKVNRTNNVDECMQALAERKKVISMMVPYNGALWCAQTSRNAEHTWCVVNGKPTFKAWGLYLVPCTEDMFSLKDV